MFRKVLGLVVFVPLLTLTAGCGGYSEENAQRFCDQEQKAKEWCMTDDAYQQCMSCYTECGDECDEQATCPASYVCPAE